MPGVDPPQDDVSMVSSAIFGFIRDFGDGFLSIQATEMTEPSPDSLATTAAPTSSSQDLACRFKTQNVFVIRA